MSLTVFLWHYFYFLEGQTERSHNEVIRGILTVKKKKNPKSVVNNAGISAFGDVEWTSVDIYKRVSC